jgi:prevent-host-death family protein
MHTINANDLKKHGISIASQESETLITIRGKPSYVIIPIKQYEELAEAELTLALTEAEQDYAEGKFILESVDNHLKRVTK